MFKGLVLAHCVLLGVLTCFSAAVAVAQDDPFGGLEPVGPEGAVDPAAVPGEAPANEKSRLAAERPDAKQAVVHDFCRCVGESDSAAVARIEKVLNSPRRSNGIDFTETPLEEVVNLLQDDYGIPIQLDVPSLEEIGLDPTEKVTANLHNISLRSALRLMLKKLNLMYIIDEEVLLITTPEEADANLATCVYNVRGFIEDTSYKSMEELIDTIVSCVHTGTWAENGGGEAEIRSLKPGLIVISQTQAVHEEIISLLKAIRDMRGGEAHGGAAVAGDEEVVTRLYVLQVKGNNEQLGNQVREMIIQSIPDAQWDGRRPDGQSVMLTVLADRIIVQQTPSIQEKVATLLAESGVATPARPSELNRGRRAGAFVDPVGAQEGRGESGLIAPPVHDPRVSE